MELRLEIKLASVEELATVAKALTGLQVAEVKPAKVTAPKHTASIEAGKVSLAVEVEETTGEDEMEEVPSPFVAHPSEVKDPTPAPAATKTSKAPSAAEKKAQDKAEKKAKEDAERQDRIDRLKAQMEAQKEIGNQALDNRAANLTASGNVNLTPEEPIESIVEEIKVLGDTLMAFNGVDLDGKKNLTAQVMTKVGVPAGVRPTQLQQPMLGQFRDAYKAMVNSVVNPVMGGLV